MSRRPALPLDQLAAAILAVVEAQPGLSSNQVVRVVGRRRGAALAVLRALRAQRDLVVEPGPRGALHWYRKRGRAC